MDFDFYSVHEVFVIASHQVNILPEVRKTVIVRYKLDFDETLPTDIAKAQFHQATLEYFISNFGFVVIRESFITRGKQVISCVVSDIFACLIFFLMPVVLISKLHKKQWLVFFDTFLY